jgi:hypothetical protein
MLEVANLTSRISLLEGTNPGPRLNALENADYGGRLDLLENVNFEGRLTVLEGAGLEDRIATVETDVTVIDTNLNSLATTQGEHAVAVEAISLSAAGNSTEILTLQGEVAGLDSSIQVAANDLSILGGEVTSATETLALLGADLATLDADLATLEAEVATNVPVRTILSYSGETTRNGVSSTWSQMRVLGTFTKVEEDTDIQLTWLSHVSTSSGDHCNFQPRIDGVATGNGAGAVMGTGWDGETSVVVPQDYAGLSAGTHTVSLWVRGDGFPVSCVDNLNTHATTYSSKVYIEEGPAN